MGDVTAQSNARAGGGSGLNHMVFYTNREATEPVLMQENSQFGIFALTFVDNT